MRRIIEWHGLGALCTVPVVRIQFCFSSGGLIHAALEERKSFARCTNEHFVFLGFRKSGYGSIFVREGSDFPSVFLVDWSKLILT